MQELQLNLLGTLEIHLGGRPLGELKSKKAKALICYLAVTGKAHSREWLATLFWGEMPESKARMNLSQALTALRRNLEPFLSTSRYTISLDSKSSIWTDVGILDSVPHQEIPALQQAARLYQGDFLEGFYIPKSPEFEHWVLEQRAHYREIILQVLDELSAYYQDLGPSGFSQAIEFSRQKLTIEPWHEKTQQKLIRLLAMNGQRGKALKQFEICRKTLLDELGIEPSAETRQLYEIIKHSTAAEMQQQLKAFETKLPRESGERKLSPPIAPTRSAQTDLPLQLTDFIGRSQELRRLDELILDQKKQLVTITGLGGIGKTRLAIEFAQRCQAHLAGQRLASTRTRLPFPDGITFIPLETLYSKEAILPTIAEALDIRLDRDARQLFQFLKSRDLLLILDNFEHLLDGTGILADILQSAPQTQILATSREKLGIFGEQVFPIQGLSFSVPSEQNPAESSAAQLFIKAAQRQDANYTLNDEGVNALLRICRLVEGMPLALELAATWTKSMPVAAIADHIQQDMRIFSDDSNTLPARHRSLQSVIKGTVETLGDDQNRLFCQLAVFTGGFTLEAARAVTGADHLQLGQFIDKSMLRYDSLRDRYSMHPLIRQFGMQLSSQDPLALHETRHLHSRFFCRWFQQQVEPGRLLSIGQDQVLDCMTADLENTKDAWFWALKNQRFDLLIGNSDSIGYYFIWRGGYYAGARLFQAFYDALHYEERNADENAQLLYASLSNWLAFFIDIQGDTRQSLSLLARSREILNSPGFINLDVRAEKAHNLVNIARNDFQLDERTRMEYFKQARALFREVEHPFGLPFSLSSSARYSILNEDHNLVEQFILESQALFKASGDQIGLTNSLVGLGNLAFVRNEYYRARRYFQESIKIARQYNSPERVTVGSLFLGTARIFSGQFKHAMRDLEFCARLAQERGLVTFQATALYYLGYISLLTGDYQEAVRYAQLALPMAETWEDLEVIAQARTLLAAVELSSGRYTAAYEKLGEVAQIEIPKQWGHIVLGEDCFRFTSAWAQSALGKFDQVQDQLQGYLRDALAVRRLDKALYALGGYAKLASDRGEAELGVSILRFISGFPFFHNAGWFSDLVRDPIRQACPPENDAWRKPLYTQDTWQLVTDLVSHTTADDSQTRFSPGEEQTFNYPYHP